MFNNLLDKRDENGFKESYKKEIDSLGIKFKKELKNHKYELIGFSRMLFEDTFIFKTSEEADKAFRQLEKSRNSEFVGWWYGKDEFLKSKEYCEKKYWPVYVKWFE